MWKNIYNWLDERIGFNDLYTNLLDSPEDEAMSLAYLKVLKELRLDALHAKQVAAMAQVASTD